MRRILVPTLSLALLIAAALPAAAWAAPRTTDSPSAGTLPDLIPWQLRIEAGGNPGQCNVSFQLTVKNKGGSDAGPYSVSIGVIRDDLSLFGFPIFVDGTPRHGKVSLSGSFGYVAGTYRIAIGVNEFNPIPESDYSNNNLLSAPFDCPPG